MLLIILEFCFVCILNTKCGFWGIKLFSGFLCFSFFYYSLGFFLKSFFFFSSFSFRAKLRERFSIYLLFPHMYRCLHYQHHFYYILSKDESTVTHHSHPKPTVYPRVHSRCTFYGFGEMHNDIIHHYNITQSIFTALKTSVLRLFISTLVMYI